MSLSEFDIYNVCKEHGVEYLHGFNNIRTKFTVKCSCGRDWYVRLDSIKAGRTCQYCWRKHSITHEIIASEMYILGLELLSTYTEATKKVYYVCSCGNIGHTLIGNIRAGVRCGGCIRAQHTAYFESRGCTVIDYVSRFEIHYECSCTNLHSIGFQRFKDNRHNCPICRVGWNNDVTNTSRRGLNAWKRAVITRDEFTCQGCNFGLEFDIHHIESYKDNETLRADVNNGITLCVDCHAKLHAMYGRQVGRQNLLKHLKNPSKFICLQ